jgi:hypothetical protein
MYRFPGYMCRGRGVRDDRRALPASVDKTLAGVKDATQLACAAELIRIIYHNCRLILSVLILVLCV